MIARRRNIQCPLATILKDEGPGRLASGGRESRGFGVARCGGARALVRRHQLRCRGVVRELLLPLLSFMRQGHRHAEEVESPSDLVLGAALFDASTHGSTGIYVPHVSGQGLPGWPILHLRNLGIIGLCKPHERKEQIGGTGGDRQGHEELVVISVKHNAASQKSPNAAEGANELQEEGLANTIRKRRMTRVPKVWRSVHHHDYVEYTPDLRSNVDHFAIQLGQPAPEVVHAHPVRRTSGGFWAAWRGEEIRGGPVVCEERFGAASSYLGISWARLCSREGVS